MIDPDWFYAQEAAEIIAGRIGSLSDELQDIAINEAKEIVRKTHYAESLKRFSALQSQQELNNAAYSACFGRYPLPLTPPSSLFGIFGSLWPV